jgi:hypothetical protein
MTPTPAPKSKSESKCLRCGRRFKPDASGPNIAQSYCEPCLRLNAEALNNYWREVWRRPVYYLGRRRDA